MFVYISSGPDFVNPYFLQRFIDLIENPPAAYLVSIAIRFAFESLNIGAILRVVF
jgi:hypothetical protein